MKSVYSAVRTGALNKAVCASSLEGLMQHIWTPVVCFNDNHLWSKHVALYYIVLYCIVLYIILYYIIQIRNVRL
jgi:hypothetical protein